jgi:hypothetical protein
MKRKVTVFIAAAAPLAVALLAAGRGSSASGSTYSAGPYGSAGRPTAGRGAKQSLLGTTRRANGSRQVTYAGRPLYRFVLDRKPGQTEGEGLRDFGARWDVVSPAGKKIESGG